MEKFSLDGPSLAKLGGERFERSGLILVGALRKNGWPRISPVESCISDGHLYLGMMWRSRKALDLLRDTRCTIHSVVSIREGTDGEFKLYGHAIDVQDMDMRRRYADALYEQMDGGPKNRSITSSP